MENNCLCKDKQYFVISRIACSRVVVFTLFLLSCMFITGYFLGKKTGMEFFSDKIAQDSFADQIYYSASTRYDSKLVENPEDGESDIIESSGHQDDSQAIPVELPEETIEANDTGTLLGDAALSVTPISISKLYQAQLLGGTLKNAEQFAQVLQSKGINARVIEKISNSLKNKKKITWYQVVLELDDKDRLEEMVAKIKRDEHLEKVSIIELL